MLWFLLYDVFLLLVPRQASCQIVNRPAHDHFEADNIESRPSTGHICVASSCLDENRGLNSEITHRRLSSGTVNRQLDYGGEKLYTATQFMQINNSFHISAATTIDSHTRSMGNALNVTRKGESSETERLSRRIIETIATMIVSRSDLAGSAFKQGLNNTIDTQKTRNELSTDKLTLHKSTPHTETVYSPIQTMGISDHKESGFFTKYYTTTELFQSDEIIKTREVNLLSHTSSEDHRISSSLREEFSAETGREKSKNEITKSHEITSIPTESRSRSQGIIEISSENTIISQNKAISSIDIISSQQFVTRNLQDSVSTEKISTRNIIISQNEATSSKSLMNSQDISKLSTSNLDSVSTDEISTRNMLITSLSRVNTQSAHIANGSESMYLRGTISNSIINRSGIVVSTFGKTPQNYTSSMFDEQLNSSVTQNRTSRGFINTVTRSELDLEPTSDVTKTRMFHKTTVLPSSAHGVDTKLSMVHSVYSTVASIIIVTRPSRSSHMIQNEVKSSSSITPGYSVVEEIITKLPTTGTVESKESRNFSTGGPSFPFYYVLAICLPLAFLLGFTLAIIYFRRVRQDNASHYSVTVEVSAQKPDYEMKRMYSVIDINSGNINKDLWPDVLKTEARASIIDTTSKSMDDAKKDFKT